jgi:hypothetical protein
MRCEVSAIATRCFGRIFLSPQSPPDRNWMWTIAARDYTGTIHSRGYSETREQRCRIFKRRWKSQRSDLSKRKRDDPAHGCQSQAESISLSCLRPLKKAPTNFCFGRSGFFLGPQGFPRLIQHCLQKLERFWAQSVHRTNPNKTAERLGTRQLRTPQIK